MRDSSPNQVSEPIRLDRLAKSIGGSLTILAALACAMAVIAEGSASRLRAAGAGKLTASAGDERHTSAAHPGRIAGFALAASSPGFAVTALRPLDLAQFRSEDFGDNDSGL
ncbi:MAG TPA: hypothetical protein PK264_05345 [Hyphomicrobiaceae bacterium]|nr:hypothetical protein [Hyphomicrobiaceae bacterium]